MYKLVKANSKSLFLIAAIILIIPALIGLMHSGFPLTDDGGWMIIRFSAFFQTFKKW